MFIIIYLFRSFLFCKMRLKLTSLKLKPILSLKYTENHVPLVLNQLQFDAVWSPFLSLCGTFRHVTLWWLKPTVHTGSNDRYFWTCSVCAVSLALDSLPCLQPFPAFITACNKRLLKSENLNQSNFCDGTSDKNVVQPHIKMETWSGLS